MNLLIVGSGSQARYAVDNIRGRGEDRVLGLADIENAANVGRDINGVPVLCVLADVPRRFKPADCRLLVAYGNNQKKKEIVESLAREGFFFAGAVSPHAFLSPSARCGEGCIVNPGATLLPNAAVGRHVILHSGVVVEHDNRIGDFANLAPGVVLAGRVTVGEGSTLYTGVRVIPDVRIGKWATVAAGALVTKDVPDFASVGGAPARALPRPRET